MKSSGGSGRSGRGFRSSGGRGFGNSVRQRFLSAGVTPQELSTLENNYRAGLIRFNPKGFDGLTNAQIRGGVVAENADVARRRSNAYLRELGRRVNAGDQSAINVLQRAGRNRG